MLVDVVVAGCCARIATTKQTGTRPLIGRGLKSIARHRIVTAERLAFRERLGFIPRVLPSGPVMIVEDSRNDALLFSAALEEAGVTNPLVFTSSYDETVAYFNGAGRYADRELHPLPLLIFMDVQMPKQSGFELLTWLRSNEASSEITVIMMSGSLSQEYPERAYSLGASFYLQKPIAAAELVEALRSVRIHWLELSE